MQISEALTKKIMETSYLTAINADRYRVILRYFYEEYEKIHYWLNKEDVFDMMLKTGLFPDYTLNQCQLDLQALLEWGNLTATQDSAKATTYQEFKNKKFREFLQNLGHFVAALAAADIYDDVGVAPFRQLMLGHRLA